MGKLCSIDSIKNTHIEPSLSEAVMVYIWAFIVKVKGIPAK